MNKTIIVAVVDKVRHERYSKTHPAHRHVCTSTTRRTTPRSAIGPRAGDPAAVEDEALAPRRGLGACPMIQQESRSASPTTPAPRKSSSSRCSVAPAAATRRSATCSSPRSKTPSPVARVKKGEVVTLRRRPHQEGAPPQGRQLHPLRRERRRHHQRQARAPRHPHLRPGRARAARQEVHAHRVARPGGDLTVRMKLNKGDDVVVLPGKDKGKKVVLSGMPTKRQGHRRRRQRRQAPREADGRPSRAASSTRTMPMPASRTSPSSARDGKPARVGYKIDADGNKVRICKRTGAEL